MTSGPLQTPAWELTAETAGQICGGRTRDKRASHLTCQARGSKQSLLTPPLQGVYRDSSKYHDLNRDRLSTQRSPALHRRVTNPRMTQRPWTPWTFLSTDRRLKICRKIFYPPFLLSPSPFLHTNNFRFLFPPVHRWWSTATKVVDETFGRTKRITRCIPKSKNVKKPILGLNNWKKFVLIMICYDY